MRKDIDAQKSNKVMRFDREDQKFYECDLEDMSFDSQTKQNVSAIIAKINDIKKNR